MAGGSSSSNGVGRAGEERDRPRQQQPSEQFQQESSSVGGGGESSRTGRDSSRFQNLPSSNSDRSQPSQFTSSTARPSFPPSAPNDLPYSSTPTWQNPSHPSQSHPNIHFDYPSSYAPQTANYPSSFPLRPNDQSPVIPSSWAYLPPTPAAVDGSNTETYDSFPPAVSCSPFNQPSRATRVEQVSSPRDAKFDATTSSMEERGTDGGQFGLEHELMELLWPGFVSLSSLRGRNGEGNGGPVRDLHG